VQLSGRNAPADCARAEAKRLCRLVDGEKARQALGDVGHTWTIDPLRDRGESRLRRFSGVRVGQRAIAERSFSTMSGIDACR
jgi:hypothetical protein